MKIKIAIDSGTETITYVKFETLKINWFWKFVSAALGYNKCLSIMQILNFGYFLYKLLSFSGSHLAMFPYNSQFSYQEIMVKFCHENNTIYIPDKVYKKKCLI